MRVLFTGLGGHGWSTRSTGHVGPAVTRPRTPVPDNGSVDTVFDIVVEVRAEGAVVDDVDSTGEVVGGRTVAVDAVVTEPVLCASDDEEPQPAATTTAARPNALRQVILRTSTTIALADWPCRTRSRRTVHQDRSGCPISAAQGNAFYEGAGRVIYEGAGRVIYEGAGRVKA